MRFLSSLGMTNLCGRIEAFWGLSPKMLSPTESLLSFRMKRSGMRNLFVE